jgi:hypothetical protein
LGVVVLVDFDVAAPAVLHHVSKVDRKEDCDAALDEQLQVDNMAGDNMDDTPDMDTCKRDRNCNKQETGRMLPMLIHNLRLHN